MSRLTIISSFMLVLIASTTWAAIPKGREDYRDLYGEIFQAYQTNNSALFNLRAAEFLRKFPNSQLADDVLYLSAMRDVIKSNYSGAIKKFQQLEAQYPRSNRVISAKYSKAALYGKINLPDISEKSFLKLVAEYPGSPEALRAQYQVKILRMQR